ncbi:class I SAM-dependent methyltransferase [Alkalihalobacillus sp. AL-G]|uniref:class I SAM-dependent methyltransferase n=1 Tax=Alkalihalobacillus sp. AL-G TaxID=2926399 RepID=UPI00272A8490|nr:class I SAM-dependent methyltransferase [Alkalihalobacillus sp. AL-G]WLD94791.1 class I SAM-dependent methyltransferase [Alkalihalobacillus sp. AL-G]
MNREEKLRIYQQQANQPFSGWDFRYISDTGRVASEPLPWSYASIVLPCIQNSTTMLDMGTGGGEFLSMLQPLPSNTFATEGYAPNVPIAKERLEPIGVQVFELEDDDTLPFQNEQFDLIIDKHEAYSVKELHRILKKGGRFMTQQVGGTDQLGINTALGEKNTIGYDHWNLEYARKELETAGFTIEIAKKAFPYSRFYDIGALIYYLKAIPWQIPDFSVGLHFERLVELEKEIVQKGYLQFKEDRFIIMAVKY